MAEGAHAFSVALRQNATLTSLSLERNNIGPIFMTEIMVALHRNTALRTLELANNNGQMLGAIATSDMVGPHSRMHPSNASQRTKCIATHSFLIISVVSIQFSPCFPP